MSEADPSAAASVELRCGLVLRADEQAGVVRSRGESIRVPFAAPFPSPRAERVLPGHLVAIAENAAGATAIVWRWFDAVVLGPDPNKDGVRLWEPLHGEITALRRVRDAQYEPGSRAYVSAGLPGADWWLADEALGRPESAAVELAEVRTLYSTHALWEPTFAE